MSPRTFVSRTAALLALVALGAACETKTIVTPVNNQPVGVTVSPQSATLTTVGQTAQFVALVTGGDNTTARTVTWSSSNTAVATVDANGVAKAVANGTASIIATSTADATAKGAALVTVNITGGTGPVTTPPTVSISGIFQGNTFTPANLAGAGGLLIVQASADVPSGTSVAAINFQFDSKTVCSQSMTQGKSTTGDVVAQAANAVTFTCQIKTDSIANGSPVFPNGAHTVTVSLVDATGKQLASASQSLTLNNLDILQPVLSAAKGPALDAAGLAWVGGDLTVKVTPAIFSGSANNVSSVVITVNGTDSTGAAISVSKTVTSATAGVFSNTFSATTKPSSGGIQGIQTPNLTVTITSVNAAGNNGPSVSFFAPPTPFRYDALAPAVTKFQLPANASGAAFPFLNGGFTFGSTGSSGNFTATDNFNGITGVDKVTTTIQFALAADTTANGGWTTVTNASQLPQANTAAYIVRAVVVDALGNTRTVYANNTGAAFTFANKTAFAVDFAPPTIALNTGSLKTGTATAGALPLLSVAAADTGAALSGVLGIQYKVIQYTAAATTCLTKDSNGNCVFGANAVATPNTFSTFVAGGTTTNTTLQVPTPAGGAYDSVYVQTVDLAGNTSTVTAMMVLSDPTAPTLGGLVGPAVITGGTSVAFSTQAADNLDLNTFSGVENFPGLSINAGSTTIGTFGLPLETSASPSLTLAPFITSVEFASPAPNGTSNNVSSLTALVTDQAGNTSTTSTLTFTAGSNVSNEAAFTFSAPNTFATPAQQAIATWTLTVNNATVCNGTPNASGNVCGTVPTTTTLTAVAKGPTATFLNPFTRVNFYYSQGGAPYTLIASTSASSATDNGTNRTWTYTTVWTPAGVTGAIPGIATNVIAVGVDAKGHALVSLPVVVTIENANQ